jgi:hypothetical protein
MASLIYIFANLHSKVVQIFDETGAVRDDRKCFYVKPFSSTEHRRHGRTDLNLGRHDDWATKFCNVARNNFGS